MISCVILHIVRNIIVGLVGVFRTERYTGSGFSHWANHLKKTFPSEIRHN